MTRREIEIFMDFYSYPNKVYKIQSIADKYQVSARTIQNDLQIIRDTIVKHGMKLLSISSKGCHLEILDNNKSESYVSYLTSEYHQSYFFDEQASRVSYILQSLLTSKDYKKSADFCDEMYISKSRISSDLTYVKKILQKYQLKVSSKPYHGLYVEGLEVDKRRCLIKENLTFKQDLRDTQHFEHNYSYASITQVKHLVTQILMDAHYKISDLALQNLIIHIATAVGRIENKAYVEAYDTPLDPIYNHVLIIAETIMHACCATFLIPYYEGEVMLLAMNLHGKREYDQQDFISDEINDIVYQGLLKIKENYHLDFTNNLNLRISLGLHIIPLLSRLKMNMLSKNIMTYTIKQKFTFAFDLASTFANHVLAAYKERLSDDEISYLALYFSYNLDTINEIMDGKSILLISSQKKSETILIQQKVIQWFHNIKEISVIPKSYVTSIHFDDYNVIITTEEDVAKNYSRAILINYFLTETDLKKIELSLNGFTSLKDMTDKFDEDLFFTGHVKNKQEAIDILYEKAKKKGLANQELYQSILLHEQIASSYFGNDLAIPHPESLISDTTFIAVAILDEAILWEGALVNVVFLVSIEKNNPKAYKLWYYLSFLISNTTALKKIATTPTYHNLLDVIIEVYKHLF